MTLYRLNFVNVFMAVRRPNTNIVFQKLIGLNSYRLKEMSSDATDVAVDAKYLLALPVYSLVATLYWQLAMREI